MGGAGQPVPSRGGDGGRGGGGGGLAWTMSEPMCGREGEMGEVAGWGGRGGGGEGSSDSDLFRAWGLRRTSFAAKPFPASARGVLGQSRPSPDRKSTRLNSSHKPSSYALFCLKKKKHHILERVGSGPNTGAHPDPQFPNLRVLCSYSAMNSPSPFHHIPNHKLATYVL